MDEPWELPIGGFEVLTLTFGPEVDVIAYGPDGVTSTIGLSGPFEYRDAEGRAHALDPETQPWGEMAMLFPLRRDRVDRATVTHDSRLRVEFASGRTIAVDADAEGRYENWEVSGPGHLLVVGTPGEPAIWDDESHRARQNLHVDRRGRVRESWPSRMRRMGWRAVGALRRRSP